MTLIAPICATALAAMFVYRYRALRYADWFIAQAAGDE